MNFSGIKKCMWLCVFLLQACAYNPFIRNNHTTGSPIGAAIGAGAGAGTMSILGGSKALIALGGIGGGAIGYYVTTLRYDAGGIYQAGGQVYQVGDVIGIYVPTDKLFQPNTADFLPHASPVLDSIAVVLQRYPSNSILISGNTSGFYLSGWEQNLSERRAQKVAAYLWHAGINNFKSLSHETRKLAYVGYGDFFPISNNITNKGIRENSRIQITSYPMECELGLGIRDVAFHNVGSPTDQILDKPLCGGACDEADNLFSLS